MYNNINNSAILLFCIPIKEGVIGLVPAHDLYTPPLGGGGGYYVIPSKKKKMRLSVPPSVYHQHFIYGLYLEHLLTNFLQTLYRSLYQEGVVLD